MVGMAGRCRMLWGVGERLRSRSVRVDVEEFWSEDGDIIQEYS